MAGGLVGGVLGVWYLCNYSGTTSDVLPKNTGAEEDDQDKC